MNNAIARANKTRIMLPLALALAIIVLVILTITNINYAEDNPGGADFIPRWLGVRLLFTEGDSPYSQATTQAIQEFMYGRPAKPGEDQALFVYPLYSFLVFTPFSLIADYELVRGIWQTTLQIALILLVIFSIQLADWRPSMATLFLLSVFVLLWYHSVRPLINGNPSILVALFTASALLAISREQDIVAGVLLGLATIKPQVVVLLIPLVLIWALSKRRWRLIGSTLGTLFFFVILSTALVPDWILQNVRQILAYPGYTPAATPATVFFEWWPAYGRWFGYLLTLVMSLLLLWCWNKAWRKEFKAFLLSAYATLTITTFIGISTATSSYIVLFPALVLVFAEWEKKYGRAGRWLVASTILLILVGLWALFLTTKVGNFQNPIMFFPVPIFLIVALFLLQRQSDFFATE
ncbi:MAG TPA: hypothetical protein DEP47_11610 [Chloroflexi bacterium]|nr:hypothetical protein [Chloroflexota bacterium]